MYSGMFKEAQRLRIRVFRLTYLRLKVDEMCTRARRQGDNVPLNIPQLSPCTAQNQLSIDAQLEKEINTGGTI